MPATAPQRQLIVDGKRQRAPAAAAEPPAANLDDLAHLLRLIERRIAALPAEIAAAVQAQHSGPVAADDRAVLEQLLPLLAEGLGPDGRRFTAAESIAFAARHGAPVDLGAKSLGKLLTRVNGLEVDGYSVRRDGQLRGVAVWRVWRVSNPQKAAKPAARLRRTGAR